MANENTAANARKIYEDSKAALEAIMDDLTVEQAVADEAARQLKALAMGFAASAWASFEARTANLAVIVGKLQKVIAATGQNPAADALDQVTGVTASLAEIIKRVTLLLGSKKPGTGT